MSTSPDAMRPRTRHWTPDSRFGEWFQRTGIWRQYVISAAFEELAALRGPVHPVASLLDAGCGSGAGFREAAARFAPSEIVAIDVDPRQIERARQAARACPRPVELRCADLADTGLPDASFDLILCHQTLHHVADAAAIVRELFRLLRPGGTLLLAESCRPFLRLLSVRLLFRHPKEGQRTAAEYLDLLRSVGFVIGDGDVSTPRPFWSEPAWSLLSQLGFSRPALDEPRELQVVARRPVRTRA